MSAALITNFEAFFCVPCEEHFANLKEKQQHTEEQEFEIFQCRICQKYLRNFRDLHMSHCDISDRVRTDFECPECKQTFSRRHSLLKHVKNKICTRPKQNIVQNINLGLSEKHHPAIFPNQENVTSEQLQNEDDTEKIITRRNFCELCRLTFQSFSETKIHIRKHKEDLKCQICEFSFTTFTKLVHHVNKRHRAILPDFKCQVCLMNFDKRKTLYDHTRRIHENRQKIEEIPSYHKKAKKINEEKLTLKSNSQKETTNYHSYIITHSPTKEASFQCKICSGRYKSNFVLRNHIKNIHEGSDVFSCTLCKNSFDCEKALDQHFIEFHEREKEVKCNECDETFEYVSKLRIHEKQFHSKDKFYCCPVCQRTFSAEPNVIRHIKSVHENIKSFSCTQCDSNFSEKHRLKSHISSVHEKKKPYSCNICHERFAHRSGMVNHKASIHENIKHQCTLCDMSYTTKSCLNKHVRKRHE